MRTLTRLAAGGAVALALAGAFTAATPAEPAEAVPPFGGLIINSGPQPMFITYNLGDPWGNEAILGDGQASAGNRDADAFYVEAGCRAVYYVTNFGSSYPAGPYTDTTAGWTKISNLQTASVSYYC
ncbi:hypothetical protein ACOACO_00655 [Nocardioides sp. CPCC 205120]|uniref:hypothetical protein n=1 Tax=Nocardioides sp. CPCC 205120 TaxID=3406462 RepID=UPI003B505311